MPDTAPEASIQRFVHDLTRIRDARDVSRDDIQEATRVSDDVLEDFESGSLFERTSFNQVYLRSLAKSYARLIGVTPPERVLKHLQAALNNRYANELAVEELDEEPLSVEWPEEKEKAAKEEGTTAETGGGGTASSLTEADTKADNPKSARRWTSSPDATAGDGGKANSASGGAFHVAWQPVVIGLVILLIVGGGIFGLVMLSGNGEAAPDEPDVDEETAAEAVAPTTEPDDAPESLDDGPDGPPVQLGATIHATIWADGGNVDGVRVQRDNDLRRPYWVEEGDAVVLPFQERIVIEGQFDQFTLFIEERPMSLEPLDAQGRRVLSRTDLEAWADTTRTSPASELPVPADTLRIP
ncbi:MAG: helix-turn-helix domain-containing protein [Longimonas sp.]|uniref:helix-turn-helix domain-containing protein n=1 Tax=Longimonas sp. TaxID=2039626 RepID=UPI00335DB971